VNDRFLITGACGFIGSHVLDSFVSHGHSPVVVDSLTYAADPSRITSDVQLVVGDISHPDLVEKIIKETGVTAVLNLAAETHVDNSIRDASSFVKTNVEGVRCILDACLATGARLVHISTDEVYGPAADSPFNEDSPISPQNPYSATKAAGDLLIQAYRNTHGLNASIIRPSNNFGPRQHFEKFVPKVIRLALAGNEIPIYGDGRQIRQWTHVVGCANRIREIAINPHHTMINLAEDNLLENIQVVHRILDIMSLPRSLVRHVADRAGHDRKYWIRSSVESPLSSNFDRDLETTILDTISMSPRAA
jgi:dTDP-glucose 4,6-dehydratase